MPQFTGALKTPDGRDIARPIVGEWDYQTMPDTPGDPLSGERTGNISGSFRYDRLACSANLNYRTPTDDYNAMVEIPGVGDVRLLTVMQVIGACEWEGRFDFTARLPTPAEAPPDPAPPSPDPFDPDLLAVVCDKIDDDGWPAWVGDWIRAKVAEEVEWRERREIMARWKTPIHDPSFADALMGADRNPPRSFVNPANFISEAADWLAAQLERGVAVDPSVPPGTVMARDADGNYRPYMDLIDMGHDPTTNEEPPAAPGGTAGGKV